MQRSAAATSCRDESRSTLSLTAWQMAVGTLTLITIALVTQSGWPQWTGTFILCIAYLAFLSNALCWGLWVFALR